MEGEKSRARLRCSLFPCFYRDAYIRMVWMNFVEMHKYGLFLLETANKEKQVLVS
jgi:hypothetical protein